MTDLTPPQDREFAHTAPAKPWSRLGLARSWWWALPAAGVLAVAVLLTGMATTHVIDDEWEFSPGATQPAESRAVAMASGLILREIEVHKWVANDPFFFPGWWLDNMPNYQQGMVAAAARFARAMADGSDRGQGPAPELERAAGLLKYPGTVWKFDPRTSWAPTASSEKQYRNAARNLAEFNSRLTEGEVQFDRGPAALRGLVAAIGKDLAAASAVIDRHLAEDRLALMDGQADDIFFMTKGRVYAYALILRELGADYGALLTDRELAADWHNMVESLRAAAALEPAVVLNGAPDGALVPSHLTAQGFYLLRARAQLSELADQLGR